MRTCIDGIECDTEEMLDLHIGPLDGWMGGSIRLVRIFADREGRLYLHQFNPEPLGDGAGAVGDVLTRCNRDVVRYLVARFELPAAYLKAAQSAKED